MDDSTLWEDGGASLLDRPVLGPALGMLGALAAMTSPLWGGIAAEWLLAVLPWWVWLALVLAAFVAPTVWLCTRR